MIKPVEIIDYFKISGQYMTRLAMKTLLELSVGD